MGIVRVIKNNNNNKYLEIADFTTLNTTILTIREATSLLLWVRANLYIIAIEVPWKNNNKQKDTRKLCACPERRSLP